MVNLFINKAVPDKDVLVTVSDSDGRNRLAGGVFSKAQ